MKKDKSKRQSYRPEDIDIKPKDRCRDSRKTEKQDHIQKELDEWDAEIDADIEYMEDVLGKRDF